MHTPSKLDTLRQAAAERRAAGTAGVPPSVLAAAQATEASSSTSDPTVSAPLLGDLLTPAPASQERHDFDIWDGVNPPGLHPGAASIETQADVHRSGEEEESQHDNVTVRRVRIQDGLTDAAGGLDAKPADNADGISVAGSVSDVTPPPPPTPHHPQLNPFTPEWFAQLVSTAATAAATAVANSARPQSVPPVPHPVPNPVAPRRLNDRKVPDFWEDKPEFWFRIFDAHLSHFNPSEKQCFDALLPLLTPAARATVHSLIRTPGPLPYSKARDVLLRHFGQTPRQLAREFRDGKKMGDKLPSEYLDHMMSILPDVRVLYEVYLLDALPDNARVAALQHSDIFAMARAADSVVLENRALDLPAVNPLSLLASELDGACALPPLSPSPLVAAVARPDSKHVQKKSESLCANHKRWGKDTYKCLSPSTCKMRGVLSQRPPAASPASGNGRAGGRQ